MTRRRFLLLAAVAAAAGVCLNGAWFLASGRLSAEALPERLGDKPFWLLATSLSEPSGWFQSDNLVSNEASYQAVMPDLLRTAPPGRVYLGVGPEQNFTYIAALRPSIAFIVDIRRGNRDLQLMYKALFELSADRVDFVGHLFARPRPDGLSAASSAGDLFAAYEAIDHDATLFEDTLRAIQNHLVRTRHLPLAPEELDGIAYVYGMFVRYGPGLRYSSSGGYAGQSQPTYAELMASTDDSGEARSFLANEASFQFVKDLETRNLVVPVVGNFGGPKALRAVAAYLKRKDAVVSAFYLSNVEQYLRQDGGWDAFCGNVRALPLDASSTFIRAVRGGRDGRSGSLGSELGPMLETVAACE
jgi:hypothetical protein